MITVLSEADGCVRYKQQVWVCHRVLVCPGWAVVSGESFCSRAVHMGIVVCCIIRAEGVSLAGEGCYRLGWWCE